MTQGENVVFSFAGLDYRGAARIKDLVLGALLMPLRLASRA